MELAYKVYDPFEEFKRPQYMGIAEYPAEFEPLHNKSKSSDRVRPDTISAYNLLHSASIPESNNKLIRATLTDLSYETIKMHINAQ